MKLVKKLRKAKKEATGGEKPETVRTHLLNMVGSGKLQLASVKAKVNVYLTTGGFLTT